MYSLFSLLLNEISSAPRWFIIADRFEFEIVVVNRVPRLCFNNLDDVNVFHRFYFEAKIEAKFIPLKNFCLNLGFDIIFC